MMPLFNKVLTTTFYLSIIILTFQFMGKSDRDYYTLDDMFVSKAAEKDHLGKKEESQRRRAIAEHQSLAAQMAKCLYCFDSSQFPKHLIVAIGVKVRSKIQTR